MMNTRTNSVTPVVTMEALQETMNEIKDAFLTLTGQVNDHTLQFRVFQTELARLSNGEGTSGGNNDRNINGRQDEMKVELAAMHVYDRALTWHQQVVKRYGARCTWELYEQEALSRFGAVFKDPIVELNNLKQTRNVQSYQDQFEIIEQGRSVGIICYKHVCWRMQEATNNAMKPRYTPTQSNYKFNNVVGGYKGTGLLPKPTTTSLDLPAPTQTNNRARFTNIPFRRQLTQKELEEKRAKNQCFYCDQRYSPGHKCSGQVHSLEVIRESKEYEEEGIEQLVESNEEYENVEI
ncbi:reverse transcriptase [Tanacetum coccineum]